MDRISVNETEETSGDKPLHLSEDERQFGGHVFFGAKLPAKWQVTDDSIDAGTGQRQLCTHRWRQAGWEVISYKSIISHDVSRYAHELSHISNL